MAVPTQLSDLSATAASNSPAGGDTVGTTMDDYLRAIQSIIVRISAGTDAMATPNIGAATGTSLVLSGLATVNGAFTSLGLDDNATAKALTLSGSGANSVTIANSATNPTIGTSAGALQLSPNAGIVGIAGGSLTVNSNLNINCTGASGAGIALTGNGATTPSKYLRAINGVFEIVNDGFTSAVMRVTDTGVVTATVGTATTAGGTQAIGLGSTATLGIYYGSGAPTVSAAKGSLYLRSDGTTTNNRMYVNTDGGTTWTAVTTAA